MHRVSDHLCERYPYQDLPFSVLYNAKEVTLAYGSRAISKYAELLQMSDLPDKDRIQVLNDFREILSKQEFKVKAIEQGVVSSCANLAESTSPEVREHVGIFLSSLARLEMDTLDLSIVQTILTIGVKLLYDNDIKVCTSACLLFYNLTTSSRNTILFVEDTHAVESLCHVLVSQKVQIMPTPQLTVVFQVLSNVTKEIEGALKCCKCSIESPIVQILRCFSRFEISVLILATSVLKNLAMYSDTKTLLLSLNTTEICLKLLHHTIQSSSLLAIPSSEAQRSELIQYLTQSLVGISTCQEAKPKIVDFGAESLVACLSLSNEIIQENTVAIINSACELPRGISVFVEKIVLAGKSNQLLPIFGLKCVYGLSQFFTSDRISTSQAIPYDVVKIVHDVAQTRDGVYHINQCMGMLDGMIQLLAKVTDKEIQDLLIASLVSISFTTESNAKRMKHIISKYNIPSDILQRV